MKIINEYKNYLIAFGIAATLITGYAVGNIQGYRTGYEHGKIDNIKLWQKSLLMDDYAEYDSKTGQWKMRSIEDIATSGMLFGKVAMKKR
jgi:hypothetical protein